MNDEAGALSTWPPVPDPKMLDGLLDIIAEKAKLDRAALVPSATMESLGIPSLDMIDILFGVEEEFNIYMPMGDELVGVIYLADFVRVMIGHIQTAPPATPPAPPLASDV